MGTVHSYKKTEKDTTLRVPNTTYAHVMKKPQKGLQPNLQKQSTESNQRKNHYIMKKNSIIMNLTLLSKHGKRINKKIQYIINIL